MKEETKTTKPKGYVYILTNPSFREDWIKIGKSVRRVDVRSKELYNTAIPLPFEIYATMKTASYTKVESMLHKILEGTGTRINKQREFFNVKPDVALKAFRDIADLLEDAEVYINGEEPNGEEPNVVKKEPTKRRNKKQKPIDLVEVNINDNLPKHAKYSLDGETFYSMSKFAHVFIKQLTHDIKSLSFSQLETIFPKNFLTGYIYCGVIVKKDFLEQANMKPELMQRIYRYNDSDSLLCTPSDNVKFYVTTQWMRESFSKLISIAKNKGYNIYIKENRNS